MHSSRELAQSSAEMSVNMAGFQLNRFENHDCLPSFEGPIMRGDEGALPPKTEALCM